MPDILESLFSLDGIVLGTLVPFLFVLIVVIFVHEMGHYLVGRWCGIGATEFSIGFGPEVFGFNDRHGTRWKLSAIPLGGYVKFIGDMAVTSAPPESDPDLTEEQRRRAFHNKSVWRRALTVAAGPAANFILTIVIFSLFFSLYGRVNIVPSIGAVAPESPAAAAGFEEGDRVLSMNGSSVNSFADIQRYVSGRSGDPIAFTVERDGEERQLTVTPAYTERTDPLGNTVRMGIIGIWPPLLAPTVTAVAPGSAAAEAGLEAGDRILGAGESGITSVSDLRDYLDARVDGPVTLTVFRNGETLDLPIALPDGESGSTSLLGIEASDPIEPEDVRQRQEMSPITAFGAAIEETGFVIARTGQFIQRFVAGREDRCQLGGPVRIADMAGRAAQRGFSWLVQLLALLSVGIGILNLLPIPPLDGGHLAFYAAEAVRGKPVSPRFLEYAYRVGFAAVLAFMAFVFYNDLVAC